MGGGGGGVLVGGGGGGVLVGGGGGGSVGGGSVGGGSVGVGSGRGVSVGDGSGMGVSADGRDVSVGAWPGVLVGKRICVATAVGMTSTVRIKRGVLVGVGVTGGKAEPQARAGPININSNPCKNKFLFIM